MNRPLDCWLPGLKCFLNHSVHPSLWVMSMKRRERESWNGEPALSRIWESSLMYGILQETGRHSLGSDPTC